MLRFLVNVYNSVESSNKPHNVLFGNRQELRSSKSDTYLTPRTTNPLCNVIFTRCVSRNENQHVSMPEMTAT